MSKSQSRARVRVLETQARERREEELQRRQKALTRDLRLTFATNEGRNTLRYLMQRCGYQSPSTSADPASREINVQATIYNEARRNLYLELRKYISIDTLTAVENRGLQLDEDVEDLF